MPQIRPISEWTPDYGSDIVEYRVDGNPNNRWSFHWNVKDKEDADLARSMIHGPFIGTYRIKSESGGDAVYFVSEAVFEEEKKGKVPPGWGDV